MRVSVFLRTVWYDLCMDKNNNTAHIIIRTSLGVQWLRIRLPVQGTRVRSLFREASTCCGQLSLCATTPEPAGCNYEARAPWSPCSATRVSGCEGSRSVVSDPLRPPWAVPYHARPSMGLSRQEYWSGLPLPSPLQGEKPPQ